MIKINKKIGETPLECLDRLRSKNKEFENEKLSYAGRLDPMAEGELLVLVGNENKEYKKYLGFDKEYIATFLLGIETDTGDTLGLIKDFSNKGGGVNIKKIKGIKTQQYPWFSGKVVSGKKLFDHFKEGNLDIERPVRDVKVYEALILNEYEKNNDEIKRFIIENISKVRGDFRQKEIIQCWSNFLKEQKIFKLVDIKLKVSSGTYIRGMTEVFDMPTVLYRLNRTKVLT